MTLDPGLRLLNDYGYNLVERHEVRLEPLDVLGRDDVLERVGTLATFVAANRPVPPASPLDVASALVGRRTESLPISLGGRLLRHLLNGFGSTVTLTQLAAAFPTVEFVRLEFAGVQAAGVSPESLLAYLQSAVPGDARLADRYLLNPDADVFVIGEVVYSDHVKVQPLDHLQAAAPVDLPGLQALLGANVSVTQESDWIDVRTRTPATVAFKCYELSGDQTSSGAGLTLEAQPVLIAAGIRVMVRQEPPPASA